MRSSRAAGSLRKLDTYRVRRSSIRGPDVGHAEHGVVGHLVHADPQPQVLGRQAPLVGEGVEVRARRGAARRRRGRRAGGGWAGRTGRSVRWARCPTIDPAVIASTIGWNICSMPAEHPGQRVVGLERVGVVGGRRSGRATRRAAPRAAGRRRGVSITQRVRFTGSTDTARPLTDVDSPVTSATRRSATRASCSMPIRSTGSTFGSLAPPVATLMASWRALSHAAPPCWPSIRAMSPKNGMPSKGSPSGPSSLTRAS